MASRDIHSNIDAIRGTAPIAVGTTGTGQTGIIVDTAGYEGVEFIIGYGAITATNAVFTPVIKSGSVTGTLASVADANLLGTESGAGIAAGTRTAGTNSSVFKRIGYIGADRYVQCNVSSTVTAAVPVSVVAILGHPRNAPVAT